MHDPAVSDNNTQKLQHQQPPVNNIIVEESFNSTTEAASVFHPLSSFSALMSSDSAALAIEALGDLAGSCTNAGGSDQQQQQHQQHHLIAHPSSPSCTICCERALAAFARALLVSSVDEQAEGAAQKSLVAFRSADCMCYTNSMKQRAGEDPPVCTNGQEDCGSGMGAAGCCVSVLRFAVSLHPEMRKKLGDALAQIAADKSSSSSTITKIPPTPRYSLSLIVSSVGQEFFSFWLDLPLGMDEVSLSRKRHGSTSSSTSSDDPNRPQQQQSELKVVGIGGDMGSVVLEVTVVRSKPQQPQHAGSPSKQQQQQQHVVSNMKRSESMETTTSSASSSGAGTAATTAASIVVPAHVQQVNRFCVKVTRHTNHFGFRTPVRPSSRASNGDGQQQQTAAANSSSSPLWSAAASAASTTSTTMAATQQQQQQQRDIDKNNSLMPNSVQERQFYGVVKAAAALRPDIAQRLLVPIASLDPRRFGEAVDPQSVAQCLLLERWDGDLRWAKETYATCAVSKQQQQPDTASSSASEGSPNGEAAQPKNSVAIPSFLRKFAAPSAVPKSGGGDETPPLAPEPPASAPAPSKKSAAVETPSFLKKFAAPAAVPSTAAGTGAAARNTSTGTGGGGGTWSFSVENYSTSSPTSPTPFGGSQFNLDERAGLLHQHYSIFNTHRKFRPITSFEALGCVAFQLFSALRALHCELPHLAESTSAFHSALSRGSRRSQGKMQQLRDRRSAVLCSGYTHNDLHSGNILISKDNASLCLCDFEHVTDNIIDASFVAENGHAAGAGGVTFPSEQQQQQQQNVLQQQPPPARTNTDDGDGAILSSLLDGETSSSVTAGASGSKTPTPPTTAQSSAHQTPSSPATQNMPFRITPRAYTPPELTSAPKRDIWAATLLLFELFIGVCPVVNALEAGNDMSECFLTVDEQYGLDWRHFESLLVDFDATKNGGVLDPGDPMAVLRAQFLDLCSSGLQNNPLKRFDAHAMLSHPFLARRGVAEWEALVKSSPPLWKS